MLVWQCRQQTRCAISTLGINQVVGSQLSFVGVLFSYQRHPKPPWRPMKHTFSAKISHFAVYCRPLHHISLPRFTVWYLALKAVFPVTVWAGALHITVAHPWNGDRRLIRPGGGRYGFPTFTSPRSVSDLGGARLPEGWSGRSKVGKPLRPPSGRLSRLSPS